MQPSRVPRNLEFWARTRSSFGSSLLSFLFVSRLLVERFWRPQLHQIEERGTGKWAPNWINLDPTDIEPVGYVFFLKQLSLTCLGSCWIVATTCGILWHLILHFQEFLYLDSCPKPWVMKGSSQLPHSVGFSINKVSLVSCRCCPDATNRSGEGCQDSWSAFEGPFPSVLVLIWVEGKMLARQHHKRLWSHCCRPWSRRLLAAVSRIAKPKRGSANMFR